MLIGLAGLAGSGKDTAADFLEGFSRIAFSDPLKQSCQIMFGLTHEQLNDRVLKETVDERYGLTPREIMQRLGTDIVRLIGKNVFVDRAAERIGDGDTVITDVRFDNECEMIQDRGGVVIWIHRNEAMRKKSSHISENQRIEGIFDYAISNNGSKEELRSKIKEIVDELRVEKSLSK